MARIAVLESNKVVNLIESTPSLATTFYAGHWVDVGATPCSVGDIWDGSKFTRPAPAVRGPVPTLDQWFALDLDTRKTIVDAQPELKGLLSAINTALQGLGL